MGSSAWGHGLAWLPRTGSRLGRQPHLKHPQVMEVSRNISATGPGITQRPGHTRLSQLAGWKLAAPAPACPAHPLLPSPLPCQVPGASLFDLKKSRRATLGNPHFPSTPHSCREPTVSAIQAPQSLVGNNLLPPWWFLLPGCKASSTPPIPTLARAGTWPAARPTDHYHPRPGDP